MAPLWEIVPWAGIWEYISHIKGALYPPTCNNTVVQKLSNHFNRGSLVDMNRQSQSGNGFQGGQYRPLGPSATPQSGDLPVTLSLMKTVVADSLGSGLSLIPSVSLHLPNASGAVSVSDVQHLCIVFPPRRKTAPLMKSYYSPLKQSQSGRGG